MIAAIPTVLVTGFLGAGKTTVINRLISHFTGLPSGRPRKLAVMINEFASIGIDGALVPDAISSLGEGYHKVELNRGSIFCACLRTDFISELKKLALEVQPDLLLIEATGIARVDDLFVMMKQDSLRDLIGIVKNICVADAASFHKVEQTLEAVGIQARYADLFILNKVDRADAALLKSTEALLATHNPLAPIYRAQHGDAPFSTIFRQAPGAAVSDDRRAPAGAAPADVSATASIASAPEYHSASVQLKGSFDRTKWAELVATLRRERLVRAKGIIVYPDGARYFEIISGEYSEREAPATLEEKGVSIFTFIAQAELSDDLSSRIRACHVEPAG